MENENKIFIDVKKSALEQFTANYGKPVIDVISDNYEFLSSLIFNYCRRSKRSCKCKSLTVSIQGMTLLVSFK